MYFPLILLLGAAAAQAPSTDANPDMVNVIDSKVTRTIDCAGRDLAVSGNDDVLTVSHCKTISVLGSRNRLTAQLLRNSTIATIGNDNNVRFEDEPGFDPQVTSTGSDNEIVPAMSDKDLQPSPPVKIKPR